VYLTYVSLLLIGQQGLVDFFRYQAISPSFPLAGAGGLFKFLKVTLLKAGSNEK
jgi:hypothetical protein